MPVPTPAVKAQHTAKFGAEVILTGADFAEASAALPDLIEQRGQTLVHPFDDNLVIAGQGTVALEMSATMPDLNALVVAVGGGGLIAGMGTVVKAQDRAIE